MTLYLIRGLPGTGKSTMAERMASEHNGLHFEADTYFVQPDGTYKFDANKLPLAHAACLDDVQTAMSARAECIIVSNTFSRQWELAPYRSLAERHGYNVQEITLHHIHGNAHGVPEHTIQKMRERWEE